MCIVSLIGKQIFGRLLLEATSPSPSFSSSSSSFLSCYYLIAVTQEARRLSVRYTERNNSALIFEKLRSKFSARCSGFLFNNGKAEHEYYFALIVCIPVNSRKYSTAILKNELFSLLFRSSGEILLLSYSFTILFKTGLMYLHVLLGEYWNLLTGQMNFNMFHLIFLSCLFHLDKSLLVVVLKETWEIFLIILWNLKSVIVLKISWSFSYISLNLDKDGDYIRKYKVFDVYRI